MSRRQNDQKTPISPEALALFETFAETMQSSNADPLDLAFDEQRKFIKDPSRLKCLWCTRRSAKTYTGGLYLFKEALEHPGANLLFMGLTRQTAKSIVWKDVLKELDQKLDSRCSFNETALTVTFPNGSIIYVTGVDAKPDEMLKLLGRKYKLAVLDEGSLYGIDLRMLVYGVLKPAMADQLGTICMMGTASNNTRGLFFDVTRGTEKGWSLHQWTALDNPHTRDQWTWEVAEIDQDRPLFMRTALYRQWYLNEWVIDTAALVYKYDAARNWTRSLPTRHPDGRQIRPDGWHHVLGLDLGASDANAFSVLAFHDDVPKKLFVRYLYKESGMDFTATAEMVKKLEQRYDFHQRVVDGANKQGVLEMNKRHGLGLVAAEKRDKLDWIRLLNDDLLQESLMVLPEAQGLADEWSTLVWVTDLAGKIEEPRKENPNLPNHASDATLYAWRYCYQYLSERPKLGPKHGTAEWAKAEEAKMFEAELERHQDQSEEDSFLSASWDDFQ